MLVLCSWFDKAFKLSVFNYSYLIDKKISFFSTGLSFHRVKFHKVNKTSGENIDSN